MRTFRAHRSAAPLKLRDPRRRIHPVAPSALIEVCAVGARQGQPPGFLPFRLRKRAPKTRVRRVLDTVELSFQKPLHGSGNLAELFDCTLLVYAPFGGKAVKAFSESHIERQLWLKKREYCQDGSRACPPADHLRLPISHACLSVRHSWLYVRHRCFDISHAWFTGSHARLFPRHGWLSFSHPCLTERRLYSKPPRKSTDCASR